MEAITHLITFLLLMIMVNNVITSKNQQFDECQWKNQTVHAFFHTKTTLDLTKSIKFTWEPVKDTDVMLINHTNDVILTIKTSPNAIHIEAYRDINFSSSNILMLVLSAVVLSYLGRNWISSFLLVSLLVIAWIVLLPHTKCNPSSLHIKIPTSYIDTLCTDECFQTVCNLALYSKFDKYSKVDSRNRILFSDNKCNIKKPERWDEWVMYHFNTDVSTESFYLLDSDNDGLVNILEYYGDAFVGNGGSNPNKADTDGDLLLDGFEFANGMPPNHRGDPLHDSDKDMLNDLDEQIHQTNPLNPDTDGDGVMDGIEVQNNADPNDPMDNGIRQSSSKVASIKLTIGDFSGSHSERYTINVGDVSHQSPGFGLVGSGVYQFPPGRYPISVQWVATNLKTPDYDYQAQVEENQKEEGVTVTVEDSSNLLGFHAESNYDFTIGKTATLIVKANCDNSKDPICYSNCITCQSNGFVWNNLKKRCYSNSTLSSDFRANCSCERCNTWYGQERQDLKWLEELNREIPCPCKLTKTGPGFNVPQFSDIKWETDPACNYLSSTCSFFQPGAYGCIRSKTTTKTGARQQCCYDKNLNWIRSGSSKAAGTPDKSAKLQEHQKEDVEPYKWCCEECQDSVRCHHYIAEVRKGPTECKSITG